MEVPSMKSRFNALFPSRAGRLKSFFTDTAYYVAGSVLYALGLYTFALRAGFATGGVSGIALIITKFTGWPIGLLALALNVPLVLLCAKVVGVAFLAKTVYAMLINTLFLDVVFPLLPTYSGNPLLAAAFTGLLMGAGLALIYMRGSSTGGSDFITMSVKKVRPHFSMGQINLAIDTLVILAGGLAFGNVDAVLYGIVCTFASTLTIDNLLYGAGSSKMAVIVTTRGAAIADAISNEVERGSTLVSATGAFTGEPREMLICVCSKSEIYTVRTAARALDPGSMIMITEASEVFGEGFTRPPIP
jgi:uncharacterized membrane-anchored protein YitT (DUF2179 family)